jgi:DNA-binding NtrC family response regulator
MRSKKQNKAEIVMKVKATPYTAVEEIMEKKLEDMNMVEKGLFKIALRRSNGVKSSAAVFLGISRNTFTDKMAKLGISCGKNNK